VQHVFDAKFTFELFYTCPIAVAQQNQSRRWRNGDSGMLSWREVDDNQLSWRTMVITLFTVPLLSPSQHESVCCIVDHGLILRHIPDSR
jgi:hypothetical protein